MGLFDNIASLFTGSNANQAAQDQIAGLNQGYNLASGNLQEAIQALQTQYGLGQTALQTGASGAAGAVNQGYNTATGAVNSGTNQAAGALQGNYSAALQPYLQNYGQAQQGTTALANALGLNGGAGNAAATAAAYASNPAYQFDLNQGLQNVLRNAAQTGTLASGATLNALQQQGQGLANNTYQQYVSNLQPYLNQSNAAASGINSTLTGLGNNLSSLYSGAGTNLANLATGTGSSLANISTGLGTGSANLDTGLASALASQYGSLANLGWQFGTGTGNANANAALAGNTAGANALNGIAGIAGLVLSDARLKEDIEPVGELYDGTNIYRFRYKGDSTPHIGLMAQEVEQINPGAVKEIGGFKAVDYGAATGYAAELAKFLKAA